MNKDPKKPTQMTLEDLYRRIPGAHDLLHRHLAEGVRKELVQTERAERSEAVLEIMFQSLKPMPDRDGWFLDAKRLRKLDTQQLVASHMHRLDKTLPSVYRKLDRSGELKVGRKHRPQ